jgi:gas vesicle protein
MNGTDKMKILISFLVGTAFGAVVALLYAPSSGQELRANIKTQADAQMTRMQDEVQKGMQEMQARMDKMSSDLKAMANQSKETGKQA